MKQMITPGSNEQGFVLVLALFMLTICTMIGMAAMSTSTTELDIAGNERVHKETFYQAEASSSAAAAALLDKDGYGEWSDNEKFADLGEAGYIQIKDGAFLMEARDVDSSGNGLWNKSYQNDTVEAEPDVVIRINNTFNADVDIDKVAVRHISGSGAEFGSGADGSGVSAHKVIYNIIWTASERCRHVICAWQIIPSIPMFPNPRYFSAIAMCRNKGTIYEVHDEKKQRRSKFCHHAYQPVRGERIVR